MGFFDFLKRPGQFPQVEMYKFNERKPKYKYDVQLDRVTNEGNPNCRHDWKYVVHPRPHQAGSAEWYEKHGDPIDYTNGFEYLREVYVCKKCEAECTMLFSRIDL